MASCALCYWHSTARPLLRGISTFLKRTSDEKHTHTFARVTMDGCKHQSHHEIGLYSLREQ